MRITFIGAFMLFLILANTEHSIAGEVISDKQALQLIIDAAKARDLLLDSYQASIVMTKYKDEAMRKANSPLGDETINLIKSGIQEKIDIIAKFVSGNGSHEMVMWNGHFGKTWIGDFQGHESGSGRVVVKPSQYICDKYGERYVSSISGKSWTEILEECATTKPKIDSDNHRTRVTVESGPDNDRTIRTMWFENDKLFAPSEWRIESRFGQTGKPRLIAEYRVEDFVQIGGMWLPKTLVRQSSDGNIEVVKVSVDLTKISNENLDFTWPSGATIWDEVANQAQTAP
jgi:hypothetical protein